MKLTTTIAPLPQAVAKLDAKTAVTSRLNSAGWEQIPAQIRDRAFFSATVENGRWLSGAQEKLLLAIRLQREKVENGEALVDRSSFIGDMRKAAFASGIATGKGDLQDLASRQRLGLIFDMQVQAAQGFARRKMDLDPDVFAAYPAQELVRDEQRKAPRDWAAIWQSKGGRLLGGRMIALKTDPIWERISRFGTPWPPFDYSSGMGLQDISAEEAQRVGLEVAPDATPADDWALTDNMEYVIDPNDQTLVDYLRKYLGNQVEIMGGRVRWTGRAAA